MASNFSKGYQSPRSPHRSTKRIQGDFKVLKNLSTSSKSSVGNQVRKILNVLKSHCNPQRHQVLNSFTRSHQKFLKGSSTFWENQVLRSSKIPQRFQKVLKKSRKCTKGTQGTLTSGSQQILKMTSNSSKGYQSPRSPHRSRKGIQGDFKVLKNLSTSSKSSVGNQVRKILNVLKSHWNPQRHQALNRFTRSHQKFLKDSSTFWENQVLRSSKIPQRVQKVFKKSRKCTKGTQGPQTSGSQLILKMSSNSSKCYQSPRSPHRSRKGIQGDFKVLKNLSTSSKSSVGNQVRKILNVLKSHWNPQRHQALNRFTRSHQKFLKDSSTFWENQVLRSYKIPQRVQKVLKKSRKCTKGTQGFQT